MICIIHVIYRFKGLGCYNGDSGGFCVFFGWGCHHCFWVQFLGFPTYSPISEGDDSDNGCGDKGNTVGGCGGWCLVRGLRKMVWVGQDYHLFFC